MVRIEPDACSDAIVAAVIAGVVRDRQRPSGIVEQATSLYLDYAQGHGPAWWAAFGMLAVQDRQNHPEVLPLSIRNWALQDVRASVLGPGC